MLAARRAALREVSMRDGSGAQQSQDSAIAHSATDAGPGAGGAPGRVRTIAHRGSVLLVDQDADIAGTLAAVLRGDGYAVVTCASPQEAAQRAAPADIVLAAL